MRSTHRSTFHGIVAAALLLGAAATAPALAADADPSPVGPHQYFTGEVNGVQADAVLKVACPGPGGVTGRPVAGQSIGLVAVDEPADRPTGYTGETADHVMVSLGGFSVGSDLLLKSYGSRAEIPTDITVPCAGTGVVAFAPAPASDTARVSMVTVTYENIAV
jgi:hypothetical protein